MIRQKKNSGFTLAELLIVVAVVGILVAISIPVFTSQLHKAKVATDEANLRSYYSVLMADYQATGKYDYDPSITDDMWKNISNTIKYKDGTTVKLKAGQFSVIRPSEEDPTFYGYQIHYFCPDGYSKTFGARDNMQKTRQVQ